MPSMSYPEINNFSVANGFCECLACQKRRVTVSMSPNSVNVALGTSPHPQASNSLHNPRPLRHSCFSANPSARTLLQPWQQGNAGGRFQSVSPNSTRSGHTPPSRNQASPPRHIRDFTNSKRELSSWTRNISEHPAGRNPRRLHNAGEAVPMSISIVSKHEESPGFNSLTETRPEPVSITLSPHSDAHVESENRQRQSCSTGFRCKFMSPTEGLRINFNKIVRSNPHPSSTASTRKRNTNQKGQMEPALQVTTSLTHPGREVRAVPTQDGVKFEFQGKQEILFFVKMDGGKQREDIKGTIELDFIEQYQRLSQNYHKRPTLSFLINSRTTQLLKETKKKVWQETLAHQFCEWKRSQKL